MFGLSHDMLVSASWTTVALAGVVVLIAVAFALGNRSWSELSKKILFGIIVTAAIGGTAVLAGITVLVTLQSETKGPVHWHADFILANCGETLNLVDPSGLSNRIGTPVLHEHGDDRIHVEGTVLEYEDVTLAAFFEVIGGGLSPTSLTLPTEERGVLTLNNGNLCPNGRPGTLQTFVYTVENDTLYQTKLAPEAAVDYILSPESVVPPADCIVIEFSDSELATTDRLCRFHQIAINNGELQYDAATSNPTE